MRMAFKHTLAIASATLVCASALTVERAFGQSLGEIARQEREKRNHQASPSAHVYTNEDLARSTILLPEDRARIEASRQNSATSDAPQSAAAPAGVTKPAEIPLGDVARSYRLLKKFREDQRAAKEKVLPGNTVLATPKFTKPEIVPALSPKRRRLEPPRWRDPLGRNLLPVPEGFPKESNGGVWVRRGDSLWKIAAEHLGNGTEWRKIQAINPELTDPNRILAGQWIRLPQRAMSSPVTQQGVRAGDSLWKIAQNRLGSGHAWTCIAQANPQLSNVNLIHPGDVLNVPTDCSSSTQPSHITQASN